MRFKQKASERAIYKTLWVVSNILTIFAALTLIWGVILLIGGVVTEDHSLIGTAAGTLISATILIYAQTSLLRIRNDMVEKGEID